MKALVQLTVLVLAVQLLGIGCKNGRPRGKLVAQAQPQATSPVAPAIANRPQSAVEKAGVNLETIGRGVEHIEYLTLKEIAKKLSLVNETITSGDQTLKELDQVSQDRPELKRSITRAKELLRELKTNYDDMAKVYNQNMESANFKYTEASGLPEGQTEILPRSFPIR